MAHTRRGDDRRRQVLQEVLRNQYVSVATLAQQLGVTEVSIRRILEQLESAGLVKRVHGGAQAVMQSGLPLLFDARLLENTAAKRAIGQAAAALIRPGETVFLDSGTTVLEVARAIPRSFLDKSGLTVVTRSLVIAAELRRFRKLRLILLGGVYIHDFDDFVGPLVEHALKELHVNTLFIGADGVSPQRGLTTENVAEAGLFQLMANIADRVVVVADSSKIGQDRIQTTLPLDKIHTFVTDISAPADFIRMLQDRSIVVILANPEA